MFAGIRKIAFNHSVFAKTPKRKYAVPSVVENQAKVIYPEINNCSKPGRERTARDEWHKKIQKLETVEEKQIGLNMPKYYGYKCTDITEHAIPYNVLPLAQYLTKTYVYDNKLPDLYNDLISDDQLNTYLPLVESAIKEALVFEHCYVQREQDESRARKIANAIVYKINKIVLNSLASRAEGSHLMNTHPDYNPRIEAFWFAPEPSEEVKEEQYNSELLTKIISKDIPIQYTGSSILQLRNPVPLREFIPMESSKILRNDVPIFEYHPRKQGYFGKLSSAANIPGFWPGDPNEFGLLSYHEFTNTPSLPSTCDAKDDAMMVQALYASYSWLLAQANYQGFSTVNELTYPFTTQTIVTDGEWWAFAAYQLNTVLFRTPFIYENPLCNVLWVSKPEKLYTSVSKDGVNDLNPNILKRLFMFYLNKPEVRENVDMTPYLSKDARHIAQIPDEEKCSWIERRFKHLVSHRPRHRLMPEIYDWERIYLYKHKTRPIDKRMVAPPKNPHKRRLNEHLPAYIPRCLRENPKKRKIGRWEKTYYPDA